MLFLRKWFQFFPIQYDVDLRFIICSLYDVEVGSFCPQFLSVCSMSGCWIFPNMFFPPVEMIMWFLPLVRFMHELDLLILHMLNLPGTPTLRPTWLCSMAFLLCCWMFFCYFINDFCISVHWGYRLWFSFLDVSWPGFAMSVILASWNEFGSVPSSSIFGFISGRLVLIP